VTDLVALANAALARADASRWAPPEPVPRLPDFSGPDPVLPRHWGRYHGLLLSAGTGRTAATGTAAGLVPGQREPAGVAV
jgi:hypothetical protein